MMESFLRYIRYEKNYSSHTVVSYNNDLLQFKSYLKDTVGEFDPTKVDKDQVRNWIALMSSQGMSVSSIKRKISTLRSFLNFSKERVR
jgi:Site-specific recombinase XerD